MKRFKMIVKANCPRCKGSEMLLKSKNLLDQVELIDLTDKEGYDLAMKFGIMSAGFNIIIDDSKVVTVNQFIENEELRR